VDRRIDHRRQRRHVGGVGQDSCCRSGVSEIEAVGGRASAHCPNEFRGLALAGDGPVPRPGHNGWTEHDLAKYVGRHARWL